jgi:hypothetical protein
VVFSIMPKNFCLVDNIRPDCKVRAIPHRIGGIYLRLYRVVFAIPHALANSPNAMTTVNAILSRAGRFILMMKVSGRIAHVMSVTIRNAEWKLENIKSTSWGSLS